jgi:hypothetical protein
MDRTNGNIAALLERIAASQERAEEQREATNKALVDLAVGQAQLRADMNVGFARVNAGIDQTNARIDQTNVRIDGVLTIIGGHHQDHEHRIQLLEQRVLGKSG